MTLSFIAVSGMGGGQNSYRQSHKRKSAEDVGFQVVLVNLYLLRPARRAIFISVALAVTILTMKSYEVIRQAVDEPGVKAVAGALKVSPALVYKWCEPAADAEDPDQSGAKNPLDRVREMYELTKDIRLIRWLCNAAGGFFVSNPVPELRKSLDETIFGEPRAMVRDFSELLDEISESIEDDSRIDTV